MVGQQFVDVIDWITISVSLLLAALCVAVAAYVIPWTPAARKLVITRDFNILWITRCCLQTIAACYCLCLLLRLPILWGQDSILSATQVEIDAICRVYIAVVFGLLEPLFLLIVLFSCTYTLLRPQDSGKQNPNLRIFKTTACLTFPMCVAQVVAALFSRVVTQLQYYQPVLQMFFAASATVPAKYCPVESGDNCVVCVFPEFSTLISAAFGFLYVAVLWYVAYKIAKTAINKLLSRRMRTLQYCITVFSSIGIVCRGLTVLFQPYQIGFELLRLGHSMSTACLIASVSYVLVWKPVYDSRVADKTIKASNDGINQPTELMPLVNCKHDLGESGSESGRI